MVATTEEELGRFWNSPGFNLETDAWVVETQAGKIVGYEEFYDRHAHAALSGDGYVHPDYKGLGIGTSLLRALTARAHEEIKLAEPDLRVFIRNAMIAGDVSACQMHEAEGYRPIRFSWHMEIMLAEPPRAPAWPAGIELRPYVREEHDQAVFEAHEEAFSDHWGHMPGTFEHWQHHVSGRDDLDPSLWFIAWDVRSAEIAGYSLCRYRMGIGWVGSLGVRRPWRKRGLARALIARSLRIQKEQGMTESALGVDSENISGATRIYEACGFRVVKKSINYRKAL
jgi:mycothiol synthase